MACLRRYVFQTERPAERERAGDVVLFSAPGEGREAVEIVRRVLDEAGRGVPFDEMAVFLRTPQQYLGLLEHACARGGVPVYFDRGTRRPDPAGRAFVALLSCAVDGLSAKRFDEYLSLGQVPQFTDRRPAPAVDHAARRSVCGRRPTGTRAPAASDPWTDTPIGAVDHEPIDSDDEAIVAGTLRSPWKWEELIVESAVVGGRTREEGKARWRRRLDGLAADFSYRIEELKKDEPESARIARFERDLRNLAHLRQFALPIVDALADVARAGDLGGVDRAISARSPRAACGGPRACCRRWRTFGRWRTSVRCALEEARDVLHDRLVTLDWEPPARRYGRLFVGTPHQARGRSFRVVFVPGLAERVVPQRPREDPLLLDEGRRAIDPALVGQDERGRAERLLLKIAIGAATERLYLSYPRLDVSETRARVPSFYALDVMRAITGRVPDHRVLASEAAEEGGASLSWPAPKDPDRAIDDLEHDLATLKPLLDARDPATVKGHAHYLLGLNESLRRSVISRWARGRGAWSSERRPDQGRARHAGGARERNVWAAPVLAVGAAAVCGLPVPVSARDDLSPRAVGRARAAGAHGSADARQPVSQGAGRVLSRAREGRGAAGDPRVARGGRHDARRRARSRRGRIRREAGAGDRSRVAATRSTSCGATSASGCRRPPTKRTGGRPTSSSASV